MPQAGRELTFAVHGLDADNGIVRADLFAEKLKLVLAALRSADKFVNGKTTFRYMLVGLEVGSARLAVREKQRSKYIPAASSVGAFMEVCEAVYNRSSSIEHFPAPLVERVGALGRGANEKFSHAEVSSGGSDPVRIDDYYAEQAEWAQHLVRQEAVPTPNHYAGTAIGSFDGHLLMIDARGTVLRGKLLLSAGGVEIDCVMNRENIPEILDCFDKRARVYGIAHYDGESQLPRRIDVRQIRIIPEHGDLTRWRGAVKPTPDEEIDTWDDEDGE
jgi:hypothetical protein